MQPAIATLLDVPYVVGIIVQLIWHIKRFTGISKEDSVTLEQESSEKEVVESMEYSQLPHAFFWVVWKIRNEMAFENVGMNAQMWKFLFINPLWSKVKEVDVD